MAPRDSGDAPASPPVQTLLLLVKQGANGLNLTEAQHVVLVEPLLDPAVEAQAVGRVHRIGQQHETFVHRFVVEASVEQNVHRLSSERAAAMDLSAAGTKRTSRSEQQALTVRDVAVLLDQRWAAPPGDDETQLSPRAISPQAASTASPCADQRVRSNE
ncbi:hypothetical protein WJX72_011793 [[Myrmecia] bisecta]|uniref:Helicase C-terminal domain-containing protein n=1 Tax=[Myrmecia] bisecta TaxID=41462 RepID=A0AAW1PPV1_9CHLO